MSAPLTLDTSGAVTLIEEFAPGCDHVKAVEWSDLSPFTQGYVEALFAWAAETALGGWITWPDGPNGNYREPGFSDLAPETLAAILKDCAANTPRFVGTQSDSFEALKGSQLWLTRQHGWYDDLPPQTPYLDDAGKVRLRVTA